MSAHLPNSPRFNQRPLPSWGISLVFHAGLIILLGFALHRTPKGAGDESIRTVGIVLRHVTDEREWFEGEDDQQQHGDNSTRPTPSTASSRGWTTSSIRKSQSAVRSGVSIWKNASGAELASSRHV